jgi:hypothetical protein
MGLCIFRGFIIFYVLKFLHHHPYVLLLHTEMCVKEGLRGRKILGGTAKVSLNALLGSFDRPRSPNELGQKLKETQKEGYR